MQSWNLVYTFIFGLNKANMNLTSIYKKKKVWQGKQFKIFNILDQIEKIVNKRKKSCELLNCIWF